jgi:hypothetical protein
MAGSGRQPAPPDGRDHRGGADQPPEEKGAQPFRSALVPVHGTIIRYPVA